MTAMATLLLTVIGDDRAGLVRALAEAVSSHGGNWSRSQLAELAGKFAGIVEVEIDDSRVDELTSALTPLSELLEIEVHPGVASSNSTDEALTLELVGNDRPGIVSEVTAVLRDHQLSIDRFESSIVDAPMGGGRLFQATVSAHAAQGSDPQAAVAALQRLAGELMVDLEIA